MADPPPVFPPEEFRARTARLQATMARHGIDALLLTTPWDLFYVTGFLTRFWESPARPWFVIVPSGADPVAVIPEIGADLMRRTWLTDIRTWPAPDPRDDGVTLLADTLAALVPDGGRIGLPMGAESHLRMPLADYQRLTAVLAGRDFTDATATIRQVREVKSEAEIALIRAACSIAGRAFDRVPDIARPGTPLSRVFRDFQAALLQEGADWVAYLAGGAGPGGYGDVISPADDRPLREGDVLMLDTGAVHRGHFCDFDRNFAIGAPAPAVQRAHAALVAATDHVLLALRPGMTAREVHARLFARLRDAGLTPLGGRLGHGLGLTLTEWPSFSPLDDTPLRAGMVLTLEPGVELEPGRILVHEENLVLRENGAELLSPPAPAVMPVIGP
ncbi:MAG: Xaa-Pro aminopeptidase [Rhodobacteraceae bacterium HLUCCA08]|nr:MAG: Xaa-Pro aminopeptidase [Rhodobacteraceae bacterium HLUCCA08]